MIKNFSKKKMFRELKNKTVKIVVAEDEGVSLLGAVDDEGRLWIIAEDFIPMPEKKATQRNCDTCIYSMVGGKCNICYDFDNYEPKH